MPRLLDTNVRTDELAHVLAHLIAEDGLAAPSSRRIASTVRLSIGTLTHHYESRDRLLRVLSWRIGRALVDSAERELPRRGVAALLPSDDDGRMLTRAWSALCELGRTEEGVGQSVSEVQKRERSLLIMATGYAVRDPEGLEALHALLQGLRAATCRLEEPLSTSTATDLLVEAVESATARTPRPAA